VPDHPVIAKYSQASSLEFEWLIYTEVLERLNLDVPRCYGYVADPDRMSGWLFLEEVTGIRYSEEDPRHRAKASAWLGAMHASSSRLVRPGGVAVLDAKPYRAGLDRAILAVERVLTNPPLATALRQALELAADALDRLARHWPTVETLLAQAPCCLVHRDFFAKNVLIDPRATSSVRVLDWGRAAWGPPVDDLAGLELEAYSAHCGGLWDGFGRERFRQLAVIASALRAVSFLEMYSEVPTDRLAYVLDDMSAYGVYVREAEAQLGW